MLKPVRDIPAAIAARKQLEAERDMEQFAAEAFRRAADEHNDAVSRLNRRINIYWRLISEAEARG